jgi:hypothetical protein
MDQLPGRRAKSPCAGGSRTEGASTDYGLAPRLSDLSCNFGTAFTLWLGLQPYTAVRDVPVGSH